MKNVKEKKLPRTRKASAALVKQAAALAVNPERILSDAIAKLALEPEAIFDDIVINAARTLRETDEKTYFRLRLKLKGCAAQFDKLTAPERGAREVSMLDQIIQIAKDNCELNHDADGKGVAVITTDQLRQVWFIDGKGFTDWLRGIFYRATGLGIPDMAIGSACGTLAAIGKHDGKEVKVHLRCAKHGDSYFIDLCDDG